MPSDASPWPQYMSLGFYLFNREGQAHGLHELLMDVAPQVAHDPFPLIHSGCLPSPPSHSQRKPSLVAHGPFRLVHSGRASPPLPLIHIGRTSPPFLSQVDRTGDTPPMMMGREVASTYLALATALAALLLGTLQVKAASEPF